MFAYRKKNPVKFLFDMCAVGQNLFEVGIIIKWFFVYFFYFLMNYDENPSLILIVFLLNSANDAKERQDWINKLRSVAEFHTSSIAQVQFSCCNLI